MGRDGHPRVRQAVHLARKNEHIQPFDRSLFVFEGSKTEPNYIKEILNHYRVPAASYSLLHGKVTSPIQIVEYAYNIFENGDPKKRGMNKKRAFDKIYVFFDRDDHKSYTLALDRIQTLNNKKIRNDQKDLVSFNAIVSVPCFELWPLSHFKLMQGMIHRTDINRELKCFIPNYEKGMENLFEITRDKLSIAFKHVEKMNKNNDRYKGQDAYTDVGLLVKNMIERFSIT